MSDKIDLNLRRFITRLEADIIPYIMPQSGDVITVWSKGVAALFLAAEAAMPIPQAGNYIVDGEGDFGIDAVWHDPRTNRLHLVSSKFRQNPKKSFDQGDVLKFRYGVESFVNGTVQGANKRLQSVYKRFEGALTDINTKICLTLLTTGRADLEPNCLQIMKEFCDAKNDVDEVFEFQYIKFEELYRLARLYSPTSSTNVTVTIFGSGRIQKPYSSFFGYVAGAQIADWVKKFGNALFSQNVRFTLLQSTVNEEIFMTLSEEPQHFWYFNNGITAIAADAKKAPAGGDETVVHCTNLSIVNGAQTAGMLALAVESGLDLSDVFVPFRVISLVGSKPGFDEEVTRANNTQNELTSLDFVSLDPRQEMLKNEVAACGFQYVFKRGSELDTGIGQIEIKEAAVALACACDNISIAVQAKRYVSGLWRNIRSKPYTDIFRDGLSGSELIDTVMTMRTIDEAIRKVKPTLDKSRAQILTHGDKFIAHCVFQALKTLSPQGDTNGTKA